GVIISFQVGQRELLGPPLLKRRHIVSDCEGGSPLFAQRRVSIPENSLGQGNDYRICHARESQRHAYCLRLLHSSRPLFSVSAGRPRLRLYVFGMSSRLAIPGRLWRSLGRAPTSAKSESDWIHFITPRRRKEAAELNGLI